MFITTDKNSVYTLGKGFTLASFPGLSHSGCIFGHLVWDSEARPFHINRSIQ